MSHTLVLPRRTVTELQAAPLASNAALSGDANFTAAKPIAIDPPAAPNAANTYSLATLLLVMTGCCGLAAALAASPGWGSLLAILSLPALLRTCRQVRGQQAAGYDVSGSRKVTIFLGSLGRAALIAVSLVASLLLLLIGLCFFSVLLAGIGASASQPVVPYVLLAIYLLAPLVAVAWVLRRLFWSDEPRRTFPVRQIDLLPSGAFALPRRERPPHEFADL